MNGKAGDRTGTLSASSISTFSTVLGQVTWLLSISTAHKDESIRWVDKHIYPPLVLGQLKVFRQRKNPIGLVTWALADGLDAFDYDAFFASEDLGRWRAGKQVQIVDVVSPFGGSDLLVERFLKSTKTH